MNIYAQLIRELKKERARINYRLHILEKWTDSKREKKWNYSDKQRKALSKRMKEVWARKRKEKANERN